MGIFGLVLGVPFVALSFVFVACYYERDPTAEVCFFLLILLLYQRVMHISSLLRFVFLAQSTLGFPTAEASLVLHGVKTFLPVFFAVLQPFALGSSDSAAGGMYSTRYHSLTFGIIRVQLIFLPLPLDILVDLTLVRQFLLVQ